MSTSCDDADVMFNDAILMPMRANTAKRLLLITSNNKVFESLCGKDAIITVDMFDPNIISFGEQLKTFFGLQSRLNCCLIMTMSVQVT